MKNSMNKSKMRNCNKYIMIELKTRFYKSLI